MARLVHRDFSPVVANFGDVVHTRRPGTFSARRKTDQDDVVTQDAVATGVQVPLNQHIYVNFSIKDGEASKSFQDLVDMYLTPAAQTIARAVDRVLVGQAHRYLGNSVGRLTEMTGQNSKQFMLSARERMNINKAYPWGRNLVVSPQAETELLKTEMFLSAEKRGDDGTALREASLGRLLGFDTYMDQNVSSVGQDEVETAAGTVTNAHDPGDTTLTVVITGHEAAAGEYVWIAGEGRPHVVASATTGGGDTTEIVLTSGLTAATEAGAVVRVFPAAEVNEASDYAAGYSRQVRIEHTASFQPVVGQLVAFGTAGNRRVYTIIESDVDAANVNNAFVMLDRPLEVGLTDADPAFLAPSGSYNLAFHRNALALVSRPLALPNTALGVRSSVGTYNDVTMRVTMQYDMRSQGTLVTLDLLCGVALLDTNLGAVLLS